jgi:prevent-host-death family protein
MIGRDRDTDSLSNFQSNTPEFLRQLKETGQPIVLTIDGQAEIVVQDARSYRKLMERARDLEISQRAVAEMKSGLGRPAGEMLAEMRQVLTENRDQ